MIKLIDKNVQPPKRAQLSFVEFHSFFNQILSITTRQTFMSCADWTRAYESYCERTQTVNINSNFAQRMIRLAGK